MRRHSQRRNVYHTCARCGVDQPLDKMRWQNGQLFCYENDCVDKAIVGSRDLTVAKVVSINRKELTPDQKLTSPFDRRNDQLEVLY